MTTSSKFLSVFATACFAIACSKSDPTSSGDKVPTTGEAPGPKTEKAPAPSADRVEITVTEKGFEPENVFVPSGKPVTLVFTRTTDGTCAKEVLIPVDGQKIEKKLPLNVAVAVEVTFHKAGPITYACGMDMIKGVVTVQ